ncbi:phage head closure protein [Sporolactobacillus sp. STSJ-5]|uniref:phage head closure protein n=1 Tax=Sporolactobacillus sp. STSJ-5 TaxID=2965076 RepID=UPI002103E9DA|nr:phage head closure protein [Sporolactobacillus sp. STSJ-5]MCQ2009259.1 phage head closure protein [Sporolactobacillus sp. STSJ-5]
MPSLKASVGDPRNISLDDVCKLIDVVTTEDELGQPIEFEKPRQIFCSRISVSRAEFAAAGQVGLKAQLVLVVDSDEYDGEDRVDYIEKRYSIYRDFMRSDGYTELYCEVKSGAYKA